MAAVLRRAAALGCAMELNAQPDRLDLNDIDCQLARALGVMVSINSDAHSIEGFHDLAYGIEQARRGWLSARDVINTRSLKELRQWLAHRGGKKAVA